MIEEILEAAARLQRLTAPASDRKHGRTIMVTGRGGTGKSTFVALAARYLEPPLLLLDIDPDQSLADMFGIDIESASVKTEAGREIKVKTLSDLVSDIEADAFMELGGGPPTVKIPLLLKWYTEYKTADFVLISLGPRWTAGDYRAASFIFEFIIPSIGKDYKNIIIDSPAGLEHLNRQIVTHLDDLFIILDPSLKSIRHVERVKKITQSVGLKYERLFLVGNHEFTDEARQNLEATGETYLGKIAYDALLKDYNLKGKSLLTLPESSPASVSLKTILAKAGYNINL